MKLPIILRQTSHVVLKRQGAPKAGSQARSNAFARHAWNCEVIDIIISGAAVRLAASGLFLSGEAGQWSTYAASDVQG
jgi:hypothetical protein